MELVESHTTARDEDMGNLAIASSKAEGMMVTLQGRQDQLDAKVRSYRKCGGSELLVGRVFFCQEVCTGMACITRDGAAQSWMETIFRFGH